ncbi:MAG: TPM domain-containing protein [bacterium]|nr:TPM domain-containing protein [bacterium]
MIKRIYFIFLVLLGFLVQAKELPNKPNPPRLVNDFVGVLSADQVNDLERKLRVYFDSTSTQIAIVLEESLEGEDAFDYSRRLAENWQIGVAGKNNGLLIYAAIKDRKIRIQNGYGMEATITDALSKRIIEEIIVPNFRQQNYYEGLNEATDYIVRAAAGEFVNDMPRKGRNKSTSPIMVVVIIVIFILFAIFSNKGGRGGRRIHSGSPFFGTFGGGGFSGGGSSGSGGSFGGFGGGSFGGGGAGGSW